MKTHADGKIIRGEGGAPLRFVRKQHPAQAQIAADISKKGFVPVQKVRRNFLLRLFDEAQAAIGAPAQKDALCMRRAAVKSAEIGGSAQRPAGYAAFNAKIPPLRPIQGRAAHRLHVADAVGPEHFGRVFPSYTEKSALLQPREKARRARAQAKTEIARGRLQPDGEGQDAIRISIEQLLDGGELVRSDGSR